MSVITPDLASRISDTVARELGAKPPKIEAGKYIRWPSKKGANPNCFLLVELNDPPRIIFGDWSRGINQVVRLRELGELTLEQREALRQEAALAAKNDAKARAHASEQMFAEWQNAEPDKQNLYVTNRGYSPKGLRLDHKGRILIPIIIDGKQISYQWIDRHGNRGFRALCPMRGGYFVIGDMPSEPEAIIIAEGWSTAAAINEATNRAVVAAFSATNLLPVAEHWRAKFPAANIIICGDDDLKLVAIGQPNTGRIAATAAAKAVGGITVFPKFTQPTNDMSDFHDMRVFEGSSAVKDCIEQAASEIVESMTVDDESIEILVPNHKSDASSSIATKADRDAEVKRLALLDHLSYDVEREAAAHRMGVRASVLDSEVIKARKANTDVDLDSMVSDTEPWPEPVNLASTLNEVKATLERFIVCDDSTRVAATLYCAFTHIIDHSSIAPLAIILAPEPRCGKTVLLSAMSELSRRALPASNISPSALYRAIEETKPTLFLDETDTFLQVNEELRGIINSGHTRKHAFVIRCEGDNHTIKKFSTWGAKVLCGIGKLNRTLMDRAIKLELRRKLTSEKVERIRRAPPGLFDELRSKLARFAEDHGAEVGRLRPEIPEKLNDRAQDNWEPLLAIADFAGGNWPQMARDAAQGTNRQSEDLSHGEQLLQSIRDAFDQDGASKLSRDELLARLIADEEGPWVSLNRGRPLTSSQLVKRLGNYGLTPVTVKISSKSVRGFYKKDFSDVWARYLDRAETDDTTVTGASFEEKCNRQSVTEEVIENNGENGDSAYNQGEASVTKCNQSVTAQISENKEESPKGYTGYSKLPPGGEKVVIRI